MNFRKFLEGNASFSQVISGLQIAWDTVSLGYLKDCPRKYYLHIIEGWQPKTSVHLFFGLLVHSACEAYDHARCEGKGHDEGIRLAIRACLEQSGKYINVHICNDCGREHYDKAPVMCLRCNSEDIKKDVNRWFPWESDDKNKNLKNLVRTVVWYLEHYKKSTDKVVTLSDGSPAVELWFRFELDKITPDGQPYMLTGHLDKLVDFAGKRWFRDIKTTKNTLNKNYFKGFSPDNQMSFYFAGGKIALSEPIVGGIIDGAQVAVNFTAFQRGFIDRTDAQLNEWLRDTKIWLSFAESLAIDSYWPMNDKSCHHYGGCPFRDVCSKDPDSRTMFLKTRFIRRSWDPLKKRGI